MSSTTRRRTAVVVMLALFAVVAFGVWGLGVLGLGWSGEDKCIIDAPPEGLGSHVEASPFPPRFRCIYSTADGGTLAVDHPVYAWIAVLWLGGVPVVALSGLAVLAVRMFRAPARPRPRTEPRP